MITLYIVFIFIAALLLVAGIWMVNNGSDYSEPLDVIIGIIAVVIAVGSLSVLIYAAYDNLHKRDITKVSNIEHIDTLYRNKVIIVNEITTSKKQ